MICYKVELEVDVEVNRVVVVPGLAGEIGVACVVRRSE